jgi:hypothetical protein
MLGQLCRVSKVAKIITSIIVEILNQRLVTSIIHEFKSESALWMSFST